MPKGRGSFQKTSERAAERKAQFSGPKADYLDIKGPHTMVVVRFLEQGDDLTYALNHRVPVQGRQYPMDVICLDQEDEGIPCPGCQSEFKGVRSRTTKGYLNVIWRGGPEIQAINAQIQADNAQRQANGQRPNPLFTLAPVYKRNEFGSPEKDERTGQKVVTGMADGVFLWKCSKTAYEQVLAKDERFGGLMSRDFVIERTGSGKDDTKYFIEPLDPNGGVVPMLVADMALAAKKPDPDELTKPPTYEDFVKMLSGETTQSAGSQPTFQRGVPVDPATNVFAGGAPVRSSAFAPPSQQS